MAMGIPEGQRALYRSLESALRRLERARQQGNQVLIRVYSARAQDIRDQIRQAVRQTPTDREIRDQ